MIKDQFMIVEHRAGQRPSCAGRLAAIAG